MAHSWPVRSVLVGFTLATFASSLALSAYAAKEQTTAFKAFLAQAEDAQEFGRDAVVDLTSKTIEEAPSAFLSSGTGHVSTAGFCAGDLERFCAATRPGEGRIALCLTKQLEIEQESKGTVEGEKLTEDCKKELANFKIYHATNINKNITLAEACQADAEAVCADSDPTDSGAVFECLRSAATGTGWIWRKEALTTVYDAHWRDKRARLSQECADEIFRTQLQGAQDYRTDPKLHAACEPDAKQICPNVKAEEGAIQDCLRDNLGQVRGWKCMEQLFRQQVENAGDIRLSPRLLRKCAGDQYRFCSDVQPGNARVEDCLEEHREDAGFSGECKEEFEVMMEARAADFRLDFSLREKCIEDIFNLCGYEKDSMDSVKINDARVIQCLQDYKDELQQPACKEQVHVLAKRASQDIRFDVPLADACSKERTRLCDGVQPGSARVIRCLQEQREALSFECRATLLSAEVRMAEDIDFKYPMKHACSNELTQLCPGIPHGSARLIRCLQEHQDDDGMSSECKEEVTSDMMRSGQDYRLNFPLADKCKEDVSNLCGEACATYTGQACGGRVLRCLTEKQDRVQSKECQDEIFDFEMMVVSDFRNDVLLAEACRTDVAKHCNNVQPGEGRMHQCLRDHTDLLTEACRQEELKLDIIQSRDIRLRPELNKLCSEERTRLCDGVQPGSEGVLRCLQERREELSYECRSWLFHSEVRMAKDGDSKHPMKQASPALLLEGYRTYYPYPVRSRHTAITSSPRLPLALRLLRVLPETRQKAALWTGGALAAFLGAFCVFRWLQRRR